MCSPPLDMTPNCGFNLNVELPKNADSVHVYFYSNDSIVYFLKDSILCSKCEKQVEFELSSENIEEKLNGIYENLFMEEVVFCGSHKAIFPKVSLNLKKDNFVSVKVINRDESNMKSFVPIENNCSIDSTYKITVVDDQNCIE